MVFIFYIILKRLQTKVTLFFVHPHRKRVLNCVSKRNLANNPCSTFKGQILEVLQILKHAFIACRVISVES